MYFGTSLESWLCFCHSSTVVWSDVVPRSRWRTSKGSSPWFRSPACADWQYHATVIALCHWHLSRKARRWWHAHGLDESTEVDCIALVYIWWLYVVLGSLRQAFYYMSSRTILNGLPQIGQFLHVIYLLLGVNQDIESLPKCRPIHYVSVKHGDFYLWKLDYWHASRGNAGGLVKLQPL